MWHKNVIVNLNNYILQVCGLISPMIQFGVSFVHIITLHVHQQNGKLFYDR